MNYFIESKLRRNFIFSKISILRLSWKLIATISINDISLGSMFRSATKLGHNWYQSDNVTQSSNLYAYLNGSLLGCKPSGASCRAKNILYVFAVSLAKSRKKICRR